VQTVAIDSAPGDFRVLAVKIRAAGFLDRRPGYYSVKIVLTVAAFAAGWAALFVVGNSWVTLGIAAFLGAMFTQLGFVGHDAGHRQVFRSRRANWLLGLSVGDALIGMSFGWWVSKHNAHHAHPNQVDRDPDVGVGLVVFTAAEDLAGNTAASNGCWRAGRPGFSSPSCSLEVRACMSPV
jgi:fatty acid desaturase